MSIEGLIEWVDKEIGKAQYGVAVFSKWAAQSGNIHDQASETLFRLDLMHLQEIKKILIEKKEKENGN